MVRINHTDLKLVSVLEDVSVELDTVYVDTRKLYQCKELIQYNKQLKDESGSKIIQIESNVLAMENWRNGVMNINCLNGMKNTNFFLQFVKIGLIKGTQHSSNTQVIIFQII